MKEEGRNTEVMQDAVGNVLSQAYEYSIEGRAIASADKIRTAIWKLSHARANRRTKKEMQQDIDEAVELLMEAKELINGRKT